MTVRVGETERAVYTSGYLWGQGGEPYTYRVGIYTCPAGIAEIYEQVDQTGEQYIRLSTVMRGRMFERAEFRTTRHLTDRGIFIVAGKWLRSLELAPSDT